MTSMLVQEHSKGVGFHRLRGAEPLKAPRAAAEAQQHGAEAARSTAGLFIIIIT